MILNSSGCGGKGIPVTVIRMLFPRLQKPPFSLLTSLVILASFIQTSCSWSNQTFTFCPMWVNSPLNTSHTETNMVIMVNLP
jgi:hypothetical protein